MVFWLRIYYLCLSSCYPYIEVHMSCNFSPLFYNKRRTIRTEAAWQHECFKLSKFTRLLQRQMEALLSMTLRAGRLKNSTEVALL